MVRISNLKLLQILTENSRTPFVRIAKEFGVSETAVRKRVRKLEDSGIIRKYTVEIDPKKIGFSIDALIGLDTKPESYISTIERLNQIEEVRGLCSSSGDHMIMVECWFKDSNELAAFVKLLEKMKGVTRICPAIVLERVK